MEFVAGGVVDFGKAPEIHISGVARIEMISSNVVRVSYFAHHVAPSGQTESRIVVHLDWDREIWDSLTTSFRAARIELLGAPHERLFVTSEAKTTH